MEDPPPAPDGFTYEMDLVDGEPGWILVPVVLQGVAPKEAGNAGGGGGGSGTSGTKRGRRGAATYPGAGKRRARNSKKKEEADAASSSEFEPEPDPEQSRSTKKRKRKMTTVLPTVVGSATEEACGAALGVWAGSCVPKLLWGVLRKFAKPPTLA
jgi:hypothetical protein